MEQQSVGAESAYRLQTGASWRRRPRCSSPMAPRRPSRSGGRSGKVERQRRFWHLEEEGGRGGVSLSWPSLASSASWLSSSVCQRIIIAATISTVVLIDTHGSTLCSVHRGSTMQQFLPTDTSSTLPLGLLSGQIKKCLIMLQHIVQCDVACCIAWVTLSNIHHVFCVNAGFARSATAHFS